LRILLVDDNAFNQRVALVKLGREGHQINVAGSGREALAHFDQETFDLILMDVEMPEMDGLQTTAAIRTREQVSGRRTPIIAMTARAMADDRDLCRKADMDGFVTKPIQEKALWKAIQDVLPVCPLSRPRSEPELAAINVDPGVALARVNGNVQLLRQLVGVFQDDCANLMKEIRTALQSGEAERLSRAAHTLKGMVAFFAATAASEAAFQLESMGKAGDLTRAEQTFARLAQEIEGVQSVLVSTCQGGQP
jgi:CheY-like chemotaxis protein